MSLQIIIGADLVPTVSNYKMFNDGLVEELIGSKLIKILEQMEFAIFNLEVPLVDNKSPIPKCGPALMAPTSCIVGIKGINRYFFTLANNHIMDQGEQGLCSTIDLLKENNIAYAGAGIDLKEASKPYIIEKKGIKLGIYCCAEHEFSIATNNEAGANPFDPLESLDHINSLKEICDFVIVLYHGGKEHYRYPAPYLQKICRRMIDKGADIVVCQHSHCIGCEEQWKKGTIIYGQGNFLFDGSESEFWQTGLLIKLKLEKDRTQKVGYIPLVKKKNKVELANGKEGKQILDAFFKRSEKLQKEGFIDKEYIQLSKATLENYLSALQGKSFKSFGFKICNYLSRRKLRQWRLQHIYQDTELLKLINYFECEAHRELILRGMKSIIHKIEKE